MMDINEEFAKKQEWFEKECVDNYNFKILVMSCDKYHKYTSELFYHCLWKYWANHPEVYYCLETSDSPYFKTIHSNHSVDKWSLRLVEALQQIDSDIVMICPDDTFFRKQVNGKVINKLSTYIDDKLIGINLEPAFDGFQVNEILTIRDSSKKWLTSMMPSLWNKKKLIELIGGRELNPRQVEKIGTNTPYNYGIITTNNTDIDFGKVKGVYPYAITEGKWAREIVDFAKNEGIEIDFSELGFFN